MKNTKSNEKKLKICFIIFLLCSLVYKNTYSEEKRNSYGQHKKQLIEKKLLLNSFKKCEEYINETSVELFLNCSDGNEFLGKSIKCEKKEPTMRGYPFYFYFENSKILNSYFLSNKQIKSRNVNYNEKKSHIEIRYIGTVYKDNLILIHTKGRREYKCSYLSSMKEITKDLKKYIKK